TCQSALPPLLINYSCARAGLECCVKGFGKAGGRADLRMSPSHRRRRRISQTMAQMSCTYICSMIPFGLISCSKASRKASNSSADSVISNGNFGKSVSSFIRGIFFSNEFTQGQCPDRSEHQALGFEAFIARLCTAASESVLTLQIKTYVVAGPRAAEMDGLRSRFGAQTVSRRPKRRFRNSSRAHAPSSISIADNAAAASQFQLW